VIKLSKLTAEMKGAFGKSGLFPFATSSSSGVPNVVPIKYVFVESDDELWLVDNYMVKSLQNMQQNPMGALYVNVSEDKICFQVKGGIEIQTSGEKYDRMKKLAQEIRSDIPARSLILMRITDIYQCRPGDDVGKKIG
jgi:predicted pyridoxine 5'-phosphate oxidase superfamily flavin-nucleotide-binding protein